MKIAFDLVSDETPLFLAAAEQLEKEGHEILGLILGKRWRHLWEGRYRTGPIATVPIHAKSINLPYDLDDEAKRIEEEYGEFFPSSFIQADRFIANYDRKRQLIGLVDAFRSIENFFKQESPDIYFCTPIAYLFNLVSHAVCKKLGIPHIAFYITRGSVARFTYSTGVLNVWDPVVDIYREIMAGKHVVDDMEMENARKELEKFRAAPQRPYYMTTARVNYKFRSIFAKEFFKRVKYYYFDGWGGNSEDYVTKSPFWYAFRDVKKFVRAPLFKRFKEHIFEQPVKDKPYYLFPLNMQPEASTLIHSEWNVDVPTTIRNISCCLPVGCYLYVKEHTSAFGRRSLRFYNEIKTYQNVRLLGPWENTDSLILNSKGVILLSSTMGWEALLHHKPVYALGRLFCRELSPKMTITSYEDLRRQIFKDYHNKSAEPMASDESLIAFFAALESGSFPGLLAPAKLDISGDVLSRENVERVAYGINQIIMRHCHNKNAKDTQKVVS